MTLRPQPGFIALITAIIITTVMIILTTTLSLTGYYTRVGILAGEFKERSLALAEACGDTAMLKLANNPSYSPTNEVITVGTSGDTCTVLSVQPSGTQATILTQAFFPAKDANAQMHAFSKIKIVTNLSDLSLVSWQEI